MADAFLSNDWYRVADLRPRLRSHVALHRQCFRGATWHIVEDAQGDRRHRISPAGNLILNLMDGRRSVQEVWEIACVRFPDDPPTQGETIRLLAQLHRSDLIAGAGLPDLQEVGRRAAEQARQSILLKIRNPLALRLPLFDPDPFLDATARFVRPVFTVWGFLLWLALVITGATVTVLNWGELTGDIAGRVLAAENLLLLFLAYPLVKAIHELGHAYATKVWGGEVHEVGVMFLVFIPVPYVDASASTAFPEKWRRAVVGGAGIMVELALAAAAAVFWLYAEPGLARTFAFNVMLIGGVSTLFFNGNPLLRFDGYFVLSDILEIPNLGNRSNQYFRYLLQRRVFGQQDVESPVTAPGERGWFLFYAVAAFVYRLFIAFVIALFVATQFFAIGVLLAIWSVSLTLLWPLAKGIWFVISSPKLRGRRARAVAASAATAGFFAAAFFAVPVPYATVATGVVWLDEGAILRTGTEGFVARVSAVPGPDAPILVLEDPVLAAEAALLRARREEMELRRQSALMIDRVQEQILQAQVAHLDDRLARLDARHAALTLAADRPGRVIVPAAADLPGRHLRQGETIGYLVDEAPVRLRVAVPEAEADLLRARPGPVAVRFARDPGTILPAVLEREAPGGGTRLPSRAFATDAGGPFTLDPTDPEGRRALEALFQFDVVLAVPQPIALVGERAHVRFDHGLEPLGFRLWRALRQLFLAQFHL